MCVSRLAVNGKKEKKHKRKGQRICSHQCILNVLKKNCGESEAINFEMVTSCFKFCSSVRSKI